MINGALFEQSRLAYTTECSVSVAGGVPISSGLANSRPVVSLGRLETKDHLDSWRLVKSLSTGILGIARDSSSTVLRKQNDAVQMKQWPSKIEFRKLMRVWCGLAVTVPWRDTESELNCKWALEIFSLLCPYLSSLDFLRVLKTDAPLALVSTPLSIENIWTPQDFLLTVLHTSSDSILTREQNCQPVIGSRRYTLTSLSDAGKYSSQVCIGQSSAYEDGTYDLSRMNSLHLVSFQFEMPVISD